MNEMAPGSCGWAENTFAAQSNYAAASKRAAGHSRDSHWTGDSSCAAEAGKSAHYWNKTAVGRTRDSRWTGDWSSAVEVRRSARCWNNSGGCCCSLARKAGKANYCRRAVPRRLPTPDDHSSPEASSAPAHSLGGWSSRTPVARVRGLSHCLVHPRRESCSPGAVRNCCSWGCSRIGLNSPSPKAAGSARARSVAASWPNCLAHFRNVRSCSMSRLSWASPKAADFGRVHFAAASSRNWLACCRAYCRHDR